MNRPGCSPCRALPLSHSPLCLQLQHLILVKVLSEDPHKLDFTHTYCFNCSAEELYRVSYVPVRDPATIEEPVLRFQYVPQNLLHAYASFFMNE